MRNGEDDLQHPSPQSPPPPSSECIERGEEEEEEEGSTLKFKLSNAMNTGRQLGMANITLLPLIWVQIPSYHPEPVKSCL